MKLEDVKPMVDDEYLAGVQKAIDNFNKGMSKMFPESAWIASAKLVKILGYVVIIEFADKDWDVTIHNSIYHMQFIIHLSTSANAVVKDFPVELQMFSSMLKNSGVAYRKVKGKDVNDALNKLLAWFKKNEKKIKNPKPDRKEIVKKLGKYFGFKPNDPDASIAATYHVAKLFNVANGTKLNVSDLTDDQLYDILKTIYHGQ